MSRPTTTATARFASLDGLRGIAAMVVVIYHLFEISRPYLIAQYGGTVTEPTLYNFWVTGLGALAVAGPQAVYVFFVLSGFVLTLSVIKRDAFDWIAYYPSRLIRLYLPAIASILFAVVLILLVPRSPTTEDPSSWTVTKNAFDINWVRILREMSLTDLFPHYNGVLWSLYFEVAFSLLLPLFVAFAVLSRRWWWAAVIVALGMTAAGIEADDYGFRLLPVFFLGSVLAVKLPEIQRMIAWIAARKASTVVWTVVLLLGLALLIPGTFMPRLFTIEHGWTLIQLAWPVGAVLIVVACFAANPVRWLLETRLFRWLGTVSFSLYLVHVPILVTLTFLIGGARWKWVALIGVPLCLLGAWLFYVGVERPSHRIAQALSARIQRSRGVRSAAGHDIDSPAAIADAAELLAHDVAPGNADAATASPRTGQRRPRM